MYKSKEGIEVAHTPTLTKHDIRDKVWAYIEEHDLANFPRPVNHRIPNFKGAGEAGQRVRDLDCFKKATAVKVNPDKPQEEVRYLVLEAGKSLLVPTPRLRNGLFNAVNGREAENKEDMRAMATTEGLKKHSKPVGLDADVKVDLVVLGSVAVSRTGRRIGKGEGYGDLEYGMMKTMGAVTDDTLVVSTVHDCQVFDDLPESLFGPHDVPIDIIVTPTEVVEVGARLARPQGIYWHLLTPDRLKQIPILKILREKEREEGKDVTLGELTEEQREALLARAQARRGRSNKARGRGRANSEGEDKRNIQVRGQVTINVSKKNRIVRRTVEATHEADRLASADDDEARRGRKPRVPITYAVFLGKVPPACRVRELKEALQGREVRPVDITWRGRNGFAFLRFTGPLEECDDVMQRLEGLTLQEQPVLIERAKDKVLQERPPKDMGAGGGRGEDGEKRGPPQQRQKKPRLPITYAVFLGKIPPACRVRELKTALQEREVTPVDITWRGRSGFAFLRFTGPLEECEGVVTRLQGLELQEQPVVVERAREKQDGEEDEFEDAKDLDEEEG